MINSQSGKRRGKIHPVSCYEIKAKHERCLRVDIIDELIEEEFKKRYLENPLEACIMHSNTIKDENKAIAACAQILEASLPLQSA